jgi:hypothetical protein
VSQTRGRLLVFAAAAVPPAATLLAVQAYAVNVPYWDQFEFPRLLAMLASGTLRWPDLVAQHNEHRLPAPRLVWLALAVVSRWNVVWEQYASIAVAAVTLIVLADVLRRTVGTIDPALGRWLSVPTSLLVFSLAQAENWDWGWQLQVFLNLLGAALAAWALARWPDNWTSLGLAYAGAGLGLASFGSGTLLLVLLPLAFSSGTSRRDAARPLAALALSVGLAGIYLVDYRKPVHHPALLAFTQTPGAYVTYVLAYLGAPLAAGELPLAVAAGAVGLVGFAAGGMWVFRATFPVRRTVVVPWLFLGAYAVLSAAATGVARLGFGPRQALSTRYVTLSTLLWVVLVVGGTLTVWTRYRRSAGTGSQGRVLLAVSSSLAALLAMGYGLSYMRGRAEMAIHREKLLRLEECFRHYREAPDACLRDLYPSPAWVRTTAAALEAVRWGPFVSVDPLPSLAEFVVMPPRGLEYGTIDIAGPVGGAGHRVALDGDVVVAGWAVDPVTGRPASGVLIAVGGRVIARAPVTEDRPDVVAALGPRMPVRSGWRRRFGAFRLGPGRHRIEAYTLSADGRRAARLAGARDIEVGTQVRREGAATGLTVLPRPAALDRRRAPRRSGCSRPRRRAPRRLV